MISASSPHGAQPRQVTIRHSLYRPLFFFFTVIIVLLIRPAEATEHPLLIGIYPTEPFIILDKKHPRGFTVDLGKPCPTGLISNMLL